MRTCAKCKGEVGFLQGVNDNNKLYCRKCYRESQGKIAQEIKEKEVKQENKEEEKLKKIRTKNSKYLIWLVIAFLIFHFVIKPFLDAFESGLTKLISASVYFIFAFMGFYLGFSSIFPKGILER
jgi:polyferredoxin